MQGTPLPVTHPQYRYADVAFSRTVPPEEVEKLLAAMTCGLSIPGLPSTSRQRESTRRLHLWTLANDLGIPPGEFLAVGDAINDVEMLKAAG